MLKDAANTLSAFLSLESTGEHKSFGPLNPLPQMILHELIDEVGKATSTKKSMPTARVLSFDAAMQATEPEEQQESAATSPRKQAAQARSATVWNGF